MQTAAELKQFLSRSEQIFLRPGRQYPWDKIVTGASVLNKQGLTRTIPAVGTNTFRAFWRIEKSDQGPQETFIVPLNWPKI